VGLYKYYTPESVDFILDDSGVSVRFSQPEILNDPFEVKPSFSHDFSDNNNYGDIEFLINAMLKDEKVFNENLNVILQYPAFVKARKEYKRHINKTVGIFSLSRRESSRAMWSYYAKDHSGFVIEFVDIDELKNSFDFEVVYRDVSYRVDRNDLVDSYSIEQLAKNQVFNKDNDWSHEQEFRIFSDLSNFTPENRDSNGYPIYKTIINKKYIKRIVLGLRASETLKRKIIFWTDHFTNDILVEQASLSVEEYELEYDSFK
jgi:uncharacterized C2H2 Zn-finger protein